MLGMATLLSLRGLGMLAESHVSEAAALAASASTFSCKGGHRLGGGDMHVANVNVSAAIGWCNASPRC
eukprot:COSAG02_NODE_48633_length_332_cov_0.884120_1_plen_67_part_01